MPEAAHFRLCSRVSACPLVSENYHFVWRCHLFDSVLPALIWRSMPAAGHSRLCSRVSAWVGVFAKSAICHQKFLDQAFKTLGSSIESSGSGIEPTCCLEFQRNTCLTILAGM